MKLNILASLTSTSLLLLSFFLASDYQALYVGAFTFYYLGFISIGRKGIWQAATLSVLFYFVTIFIYFMVTGVLNDNQTFPNPIGFLISSAVFFLFFKTGSFISFYFKKEKIRGIVFFTILMLLLSISTNFFGHGISIILTGIIYFVGSFFLFHKLKNRFLWVLVSFTFSYLIVHLLGAMGEGGMPQISYPKVLFIAVSVLLAYWLEIAYANRAIKKVYFIVFIELCFAIIGYGFEINWLEYLSSRVDRIPVNNEIDLSFLNENDSNVSITQWKGKIVVLDFWTSTCTVCFKKFPEFEEFYQKYKHRKDMIIYAVNIPVRISDSLQEIKRICGKFNYNFPFLFALQNYDYYEKEMKINGVPHLAIFNKKGKLVYSGSFNNNPLIFVNNLERIIDTIQ